MWVPSRYSDYSGTRLGYTNKYTPFYEEVMCRLALQGMAAIGLAFILHWEECETAQNNRAYPAHLLLVRCGKAIVKATAVKDCPTAVV